MSENWDFIPQGFCAECKTRDDVFECECGCKKELCMGCVILLNENKLPHAPICWKCAKKLGGIAPDYPVTQSVYKCKHCDEEIGCPSVTDFDWPKLGIKRIWD